MEQKNEFVILTQERLDGLVKLLIKLFPRTGIKIAPEGGARETIEPIEIDAGKYGFFLGSTRIGEYEYQLINGLYKCSLDLRGLPEELYIDIKNNIESKFPEIALE